MSTKVRRIEVGLMIVLVMTGFVITVSQTVSALPISEEQIREKINLIILEFQLKAAEEKLQVGGGEQGSEIKAEAWIRVSEALGNPEVQEQIITIIKEGTTEEEAMVALAEYIAKLYLTLNFRMIVESELQQQQ